MSDEYRIRPGSNPFVVHSPEDLHPEEVVRLFVDVLADFTKVANPGHMMIHGPRGSGKSMIFRYLQPDCQRLAQGVGTNELRYFGLYVGVKRSDLGLTELRRLSGETIDYYLLEHLMVMQVLCCLLDDLQRAPAAEHEVVGKDLIARFWGDFAASLIQAGFAPASVTGAPIVGAAALFARMNAITLKLKQEATTYIRRLGSEPATSYAGPLCGYADFLLPLFGSLRSLGVLPSAPVYLLVDDGDLLSMAQTRVLNSWLYSRTSLNVSIKVTTQYRYKTLRTPAGTAIEAPHDLQEVDTAQLYTAAGRRYSDLVSQILQRRFDAAAIDATPQEFFPKDVEQEAQIQQLADKLKDEWSESGRGARPTDDAVRYARPDFIRQLKGQAKSGSSYSYAGFAQLVHVSSGVYRFFLDPASQMYDRQFERNNGSAVLSIDADLQNDAVRDEANKLLYKSFDEMQRDASEVVGGEERVRVLQNLVHTLGGIFQAILLSSRSERRVFSIALSQQPDQKILDVLSYGVASGYFTEATIGNKEGTGRTRLYVLTRRLAPAFLLDPFGFAGYLFVTNQFLHKAMANPASTIREFTNRMSEPSDDGQLPLFD